MTGRAGLLLGLSGVLALGACTDPEAAREERVHDMMATVLEPAADEIWDRAGYVVTEAGEQSLFPADAAGWGEVAESARNLQALGGRLLTDEYAPPGEAAWNDYAQGIVTASERLEAAALAQDEDALFAAGGTLYSACLGCHERYIVDDMEMAGE